MSRGEAELIIERHYDNCLCACSGGCAHCPDCQDQIDSQMYGSDAKDDSLTYTPNE